MNTFLNCPIYALAMNGLQRNDDAIKYQCRYKNKIKMTLAVVLKE